VVALCLLLLLLARERLLFGFSFEDPCPFTFGNGNGMFEGESPSARAHDAGRMCTICALTFMCACIDDKTAFDLGTGSDTPPSLSSLTPPNPVLYP